MFFTDLIDEDAYNVLDTVEAAPEKDIDNFLEYAISNCADDAYNFNAIMRPLALYEMGMYKRQLLKEDDTDEEETDIDGNPVKPEEEEVQKGFFAKFKELIKRAWSRIVGLWNSFKTFITGKVDSLRKFISKHKAELSKKYAAAKSRIKGEGHKYNFIIDMKAIFAAIREEIADMRASHPESSESKEENKESSKVFSAASKVAGKDVKTWGEFVSALKEKISGEKVSLVDAVGSPDEWEATLAKAKEVEKNTEELKKLLGEITKACDTLAKSKSYNRDIGKTCKNIHNLVSAAQQSVGAMQEGAKSSTVQIAKVAKVVIKDVGEEKSTDKDTKETKASESAVDSIFGTVELI